MTKATQTRFVAYFRVSTDKQGASGLGLEAQRAAVETYVGQQHGLIVDRFQEVETGKLDTRPALAAALAACRAHKAVLIVAKLDRLARNARFLLDVVEGAGNGGVVFCDLPTIPAGPVGKFLISQMAAVAELEAGLISQRTKAALTAAKARGVKLGNPNLQPGSPDAAKAASAAASAQAKQRAQDVLPMIRAAQAAGATTLAAIAAAMTARGIPTPGGRGGWHPATVARVLKAA